MEPRLPRVSALAVAGALIAGGVDVREGDSDAVGHERVDLDGRCVLPAFTDAHVHFQEWSLAREQLDLSGCASKAEALRRVADAGGEGGCAGAAGSRCAGRTGPQRGRPGHGAGRAPGGALVAGRPHALGELGRPGGRRVEHAASGVLREQEAFAFPLPPPEPLELSRAVRNGVAEANARGVVSVHDFQRPGGRGLWQRLDADRRLHMRVHMSVPVEMLGAAAELELRSGFGSELCGSGR